jgi:hypothetical protein
VKLNMTRGAVAALVWVILMLTAASIRAEEKEAAPPPAKEWKAEKIGAKDIPKNVTDTVLKALNGGGTITGAIKVTEDGKVVYKVEVYKMKVMVLTVDAAGKLLTWLHE